MAVENPTKMNFIIPPKERKRLLYREIKALYKIGYTMEQISLKLNVSKTTVFFAVKGRSKKSVVSRNKNNNKN